MNYRCPTEWAVRADYEFEHGRPAGAVNVPAFFSTAQGMTVNPEFVNQVSARKTFARVYVEFRPLPCEVDGGRKEERPNQAKLSASNYPGPVLIGGSNGILPAGISNRAEKALRRLVNPTFSDVGEPPSTRHPHVRRKVCYVARHNRCMLYKLPRPLL